MKSFTKIAGFCLMTCRFLTLLFASNMKIIKSAIMIMAVTSLIGCAGSPNKGNNSESNSTEAVSEENTASEVESKGDMAPDFTLKSIDGRDIMLSALQGKYVVLDFWGSWCPWCIKGFPDMKESYKKYADKVEFIGMDCNDREEDWREAVKENTLPWIQVRVPDDSDLLERYGIEGFPTKIVIDKKGKIIKTVVGEDPEFYEYLDQLLG